MGEALPQVHYAHSGDVEIAYTSVGDGPVDLILVWGWLTNLEVYWDEPAFRRFVERLAAFARVIIFDKRGMGLSDRTTLGTLEERMDDVRAVMDAIGSERAVLLGVSEGAPLSILFAASHPERTQALVFAGGEVKEVISDDWPWGQSTREEYDRYLDDFLVSHSWGKATRAFFAPSRADDPALMEWLGRLERSSASPAAAVAFMRMGSHIDVRAVVPSVHVPALVLHSRRDSVVAFEQGRWLADTLPDARFVELKGQDHGPQFDSVDQVIEEVRDFLTGSREPVEPEQVLATVLFTDLVGSTERRIRSGTVAGESSSSVTTMPCATELARYRGREIDTAGDGFFASFDGPARAIRCALAVLAALDRLGLPARSGLHTGECEVVDGKLAGIAVHTGARVAAEAKAGEVLVSQTVRDLVAGSGIEFADRGLHVLKGLPEPRRLFAVEPA